MDDDNNNNKHTIITLSPDTTGKGNEGDTKNKKFKSNDCNVNGKILLESLNDESAVGNEETKANEWDDVGKHCKILGLQLKIALELVTTLNQ